MDGGLCVKDRLKISLDKSEMHGVKTKNVSMLDFTDNLSSTERDGWRVRKHTHVHPRGTSTREDKNKKGGKFVCCEDALQILMDSTSSTMNTTVRSK